MFEEQLAIITGLWTHQFASVFVRGHALPTHRCASNAEAIATAASTDRDRRHWNPRTPRLAAMYADDFNAGFMTVNDTADQFARVLAACEAISEDLSPSTLSND